LQEVTESYFIPITVDVKCRFTKKTNNAFLYSTTATSSQTTSSFIYNIQTLLKIVDFFQEISLNAHFTEQVEFQ